MSADVDIPRSAYALGLRHA